LFVEVAHEANSNSIFVNLSILGITAVDAMLLVDPALGDFDLPVARPGPISNHEMVPATIVTQYLSMLGVDLVVVPGGMGAMVQDDVLPRSVSPVGIKEFVPS
jgi:hypothetical protein